MGDAQDITDEVLATLAEETRAKNASRRVIVVARDRLTAAAWSKHRRIRCFFAEDESLLYGVGETETIVLVKGYRSHPKWSRLHKRLQVVGTSTDIWIDEVPEELMPAPPAIGGAFVAGRNITQVRPDEDQGDTFILSNSSNSIKLTRAQVEVLRDLLEGFLEGEPVPDEALDRFDEIRAQIEATGDLYGRAG